MWLIDHYDSFSFNLRQLLFELVPHAGIKLLSPQDEIPLGKPDLLVIGPGPGAPLDYPKSLKLIKENLGEVPCLGVCLGMQMLGLELGAKVFELDRPFHGKTSELEILDREFFNEFSGSLEVMRYHSLGILGGDLNVLAHSGSIPMIITNSSKKCLGVQFHPESFLGEVGKFILAKWLKTYVY
jgi:anthranilate synthase/aminodeoxychorismate synthase-like glutamine amidotransferase